MVSTYGHLGTIYEIQVQGQLDPNWQHWFNGLALTVASPGDQSAVTTLTGPVADQAALRGVLCKLWDMNLALISVRRLEAGGNREQADEHS